MKKIITVIFVFSLALPLYSVQATTIQENLKHIVKISCGYFDVNNDFEIWTTGSGVILAEDLVITNAHVVFDYDYDGTLFEYDMCVAGYSANSYTPPEALFFLRYFVWNFDDNYDYAFMTPYDLDTNDNEIPYLLSATTTYGNADSLVHGDDLTLIGYPDLAGSTITSTQGSVSGFNGTDWIKSDAIAEFGNSGGGAFDGFGQIVGIPTSVIAGDLNSFTNILNLNAIFEDAFGTDYVYREYSTLYTVDNVVCYQDGECFNIGEEADEDTGTDSGLNGSDLGAIGGQYDYSKHDSALINRLEGNILLQVEDNGEAWYVNPDDNYRYYMRDGDAAYQMMRSFGLGITDADLAKIPLVSSTTEMNSSTSVCSSNSLAKRLKGQILLQVDQHGEAWYIHPDKCRRIYMQNGAAAYEIMRFLGLGISNLDLTKMPTNTVPIK